MAQTKILGRVTDPVVGGAVYEDTGSSADMTTVLDRAEITAADRAMQRAVALGTLDQNFVTPLLSAGARRVWMSSKKRERRRRRRQFAYAQKQFGKKYHMPYEARWWVVIALGAALVLASMVGIGVALIVQNLDKVETVCW